MCYHHLQKRGVIFMCFQNDSTKMFIQEAFCLGDRILGTIFNTLFSRSNCHAKSVILIPCQYLQSQQLHEYVIHGL